MHSRPHEDRDPTGGFYSVRTVNPVERERLGSGTFLAPVPAGWQASEVPEGSNEALRLLALLQTHRLWHAEELSERLGVTQRTVRRDLDRLRELGYPVDSTSGKPESSKVTK